MPPPSEALRPYEQGSKPSPVSPLWLSRISSGSAPATKSLLVGEVHSLYSQAQGCRTQGSSSQCKDRCLSFKGGNGDYKYLATFHYIEGKQRRTAANDMVGYICICEVVCLLVLRTFTTS